MKIKRYLTVLIGLIHVGLLISFSWNAKFSISDHDEPIYLGAGSYIWHTGSVANKMTEAHPPLTYYFNSLFLGKDPIDWSRSTDWFKVAENIENPSEQEMTLHFLESIGQDILRQNEAKGISRAQTLFYARLPFIILCILFFVSMVWFLKESEPWVVLTSLILYAFSPLVIFQSPTLMTDVPMVIFMTWSLMCWCRYHHARHFTSLVGASIFQGLALGCKVSAVLGLPVGPLMIILFDRDRFKKITLSCGIIFLTLWAVYGFQIDSIKNVEKKHHIFPMHEMRHEKPPLSRLERESPRLYEAKLPMVSFLMPLRLVFHRRGNIYERTAIEGPFRYWVNTAWYPWTVVLTYFPLAFFGFLIWISCQRIPKETFMNKLPLILFPAIYIAASFSSKYMYGVRHVLPIFAPLVLWGASAVTSKFSTPPKWLLVFVVCTMLELVLFLTTGSPWSLWMYGWSL